MPFCIKQAIRDNSRKAHPGRIDWCSRIKIMWRLTNCQHQRIKKEQRGPFWWTKMGEVVPIVSVAKCFCRQTLWPVRVTIQGRPTRLRFARRITRLRCRKCHRPRFRKLSRPSWLTTNLSSSHPLLKWLLEVARTNSCSYCARRRQGGRVSHLTGRRPEVGIVYRWE